MQLATLASRSNVYSLRTGMHNPVSVAAEVARSGCLHWDWIHTVSAMDRAEAAWKPSPLPFL